MAGNSMRQLARRLGRLPSTISREIARNGGRWAYRAASSDARAWQRTLRPKQCALAGNSTLRRIVALKLQEDWSPQQIAGWLKCTYQNDSAMAVISRNDLPEPAHSGSGGILKKALISHLRSRRMMQRAKRYTTAGQPRGQIVDAVSISERPAEVEDQAIPGHWEADLIIGSSNSHIATLVKRHCRYAVLVHIAGKNTSSVVNALVRQGDSIARRLGVHLSLGSRH